MKGCEGEKREKILFEMATEKRVVTFCSSLYEKRIQPILRAINGPIFDEYNCQWLDVIDSYANRLLYIIRLFRRANTGCAVLGPLQEKIFRSSDRKP